MGEDILKFVGSNPGSVYSIDIISHIFVVKIVMFVWKDENENEKETREGPFKK